MPEQPPSAPVGEWVDGVCPAKWYVHDAHRYTRSFGPEGLEWADCPGTGVRSLPADENASTPTVLCPACGHWLDTNHGARGCYECDCEVTR